MHFPFLRLLLAATIISLTHAQSPTARNDLYGIRYCGSGPSSHGATLQALLPRFRHQLQIVQVDAQKGIESKAFRAFFKDQRRASHVQTVFKQMAGGRPVTVPSDTARIRFETPNIMCLDDPLMPDYDGLKMQCGIDVLATTKRDRAIVVLCDPFWGLDAAPKKSECPVVRGNVFVQNEDDRVIATQFGVFVHEMAHAYAGSWRDDETKGLMDCVKLDAGKAVKNVQSFALYAASELRYFLL
ncbi:MAG: hypothetical protein Q9168_006390 [Polycauliona sp. 1 TL-2023]